MTKTAQTDAAVTRFLDAWRRHNGPDKPPQVLTGRRWWRKSMTQDERALFDNFQDFGRAVSVRLVAAS